MTGRTHDLASFSLISYIFIRFQPLSMSLATLISAAIANMIGALYPDIDNESGDLWKKIPGGSIIGQLVSPLLGGHRMISHSLLGILLTGYFLDKLLIIINQVVLVDMAYVWLAFMIGYISHLIADSITKEGIPLFFPIPISIGFPPFKSVRINTGGRLEKYIIYPSLLLLTGYLYIRNYSTLLDFFQHRLH